MQRQHLRREPIGQLLVGLAVACLLVLPVLPAQAQRTASYIRSAVMIAQNSAQFVDYLHSNSQHWCGLTWRQLTGESGETLYPGAGLLFLAVLGVGWNAEQRRRLLFGLVSAAVTLLLSLGLNLTIGGWAPYQLLHAYYLFRVADAAECPHLSKC